MSVRKTESKIPDGLSAPADLGQAVTNANGSLISFLSSPVVVARIQQYVVFPAAGIAANVTSYRWTMNNSGTTNIYTSTIGYLEYTPDHQGTLSVSVELLNSSNAAIATFQLQQNVTPLITQLERLVDQEDRYIPAAAHPATSREVINDLRAYIDALAPPPTENLLNRLILSQTYATALLLPQLRRNTLLEDHAAILNNNRHADFLQNTENGIGISRLRPQLLAMFLNKAAGETYIPFTDLPANRRQRATALRTIQTAFNGLQENEKIDLYNRLRFPKSNAAMCKLVLEELKNRYFSGETFQEILSDRTRSRQLLTHFQNGPWKVPASGSITLTPFSRRVVNLMYNPIWTVIPAGSAEGVGLPMPPAGPIVVGDPEHIPQQTFVATPRRNDNGFIRSAFLYHETYGLRPQMVDSFEHLIQQLSLQNSHLGRVRIVSHFYLPPTGSQFLSNMNMAFFTGATDYTMFWHFRFGISDEEGLKALIENVYYPNLTPGYFSNSTTVPFDPTDNTRMEPLWRVIIRGLRINNPDVLRPFNLINAWPPPGALSNLIRLCTDIFKLNNITLQLTDNINAPTVNINAPALVKNAIINELQQRIDQIKPSLGNLDNVNDLVAAITGTTLANLLVPISSLGDFVLSVGHPSYLRDHTVFRQNLNAVRARLDNSSVVDIRGCRVGQDEQYMQALKDFFCGAATHPTITAPEWFQSFDFLGYEPCAAEANVDQVFREGFASTITTLAGTSIPVTYAGADVRREYSNWSGRIGIPAHISFWNQVFHGDTLEFLTLRWKTLLPGIGMEAVRLSALSDLGYSDMIARLQEIFDIPAGSVPASGILQAFGANTFPQVIALRDTELAIAASTATSTQAELQNKLAMIQPIAAALGQLLPVAPSPLTLSYMQQSVQQLKQYVIIQAQINNFIQAVTQKLADPRAGIRYLLFIGLPLCVQARAREEAVVLVVLDALKDDALKSWMTIHWAEPLPNPAFIQNLVFNWANGRTMNDQGTANRNDDTLESLGNALQVAALANNRARTIFVINPMYEYQQHIKSL